MSLTHRQKAARALAKKTGVPYQQALNCLLESLAEVEAGLPEVQRRSQWAVGTGGVNPMAPNGRDTVLSPFLLDSVGRDGSTPIGLTVPVASVPVFFDPHEVIGRGFSPVTTIVGDPGSGRSVLSLLLARQFAGDDIRTVFVDLAAGWLAEAAELEGAEAVDLRGVPDGGLNPFGLAETLSEQKLLALTLLRLLAGGRVSEQREELLLIAVDAVAKEPSPSLGKVVDSLVGSDVETARTLGGALRTLRDLPFAGLLFGEGPVLSLTGDVSYVSALGLSLPSAGDGEGLVDWTPENRVAVAVMHAVVTRATQVLGEDTSRSSQKALIVRDVDALLSYRDGERLLVGVSRLGRARNVAVVLEGNRSEVLVSADAHVPASTRFVFRTGSQSGQFALVSMLDGLADGGDGYRRLVRNLGNGQVVMHADSVADPVVVQLSLPG